MHSRGGVLCALLAASLISAFLAHASGDRVLLRDVSTLMFERNKLTAARRVAPMHQMTQVGGPRVDHDAILCTNAGWDGKDVIWECRLRDDVPARLGRFEISCEGYDHAGDAYHLAGSCGIEYTLTPVPRPVQPTTPKTAPRASLRSSQTETREDTTVAIATTVVFTLVLIGGFSIGGIALFIWFRDSSSHEKNSIHIPPTPTPSPVVSKASTPEPRQPSPKRVRHVRTESTRWDDLPAPVPQPAPTKSPILHDDYVPAPAPAPAHRPATSAMSSSQNDDGWSTLAMFAAGAAGYALGSANNRAPAPAPRARAPSPQPTQSSGVWSSMGGSSSSGSGSESGSNGWSSSSTFGKSKTR